MALQQFYITMDPTQPAHHVLCMTSGCRPWIWTVETILLPFVYINVMGVTNTSCSVVVAPCCHLPQYSLWRSLTEAAGPPIMIAVVIDELKP